MTELNTSTGKMAWAHSNVWAGGHLNATYDPKGLHFHLADPLGTRRVQANALGAVEETCQSLFFGEQLNCVQTALATASDATEHHFTGKERDTESGLDYFGARYYSSNMGRFMSPDWASHPQAVPYASLGNPQSLNLYAYVNNNPLSEVDADGHFASPWHFLLSFVAAIATGHNPVFAAKLGYHNVMKDLGTQGGTPDQTGIHGMGAGLQTSAEAREDTVQALQTEQANGDLAGEQHTVQDPWASGHDYQDWPGSFGALGLWGTIKHEVGDWLPKPWALWGALTASIRDLRDPNASADSLLRGGPGGSSPTNSTPSPMPGPGGGGMHCIGCFLPPGYSPTPPQPTPMPDPSKLVRVAQ